MTLEAWTAALRAAFLAHCEGADASHDIGHMDRVWAMARRIGAEEGCDLFVLAAGAYLHDLVNLPKNAPNRTEAAALSAAKAAPLLRAMGADDAPIAAVAHVIEAHSFSAGLTPQSREAEALRDADRLESLGAVGLARVFATSGAMGRSLLHPTDPLALAREKDQTQYGLDHVLTKFAALPDTMRTATGKAMAAARWRFTQEFIAQLVAESEGAR